MIYDVIIIGSGPAALTAAIYTTRGAASTLIIGGFNWGGQLMLTTMVDNFPGFSEGIMGPELMENMKKQALRFGAQFEPVDVVDIDTSNKPFMVTTKDAKYQGKAIIVATGAETVWLGVPGEEKLIGRGVSSCAPCDAPFFKNKKVAVVGGGDAAMEEALVLSKFASEVTIIHRREEFRASQAMQDHVFKNKSINILWNTEVLEMFGEQKLEKLKLKNNKENTESELMVDGVFVAIGHTPKSSIFTGKLEIDEKGFIKIQNHTNTSVEGIFVAGDVHDMHYKQAITASGFGCMAALDVLKYLDQI
jgi:thioredoxin reductase (NADPH)